MNLPFTINEFLAVFEMYNRAVWPMPIAAYVLGIGAVIAVWFGKRGVRIASAILAFLWLWTGIVYHGIYFRSINPAALIFAALFVIQAVLFFWIGTMRGKFRYTAKLDFYKWAGGILMLFAMAAYPLIGSALGHGYPHGPSFGITPCPLTIFTFGLLLWLDPDLSRSVLIIPFVWSLIGSTAALTLHMFEDVALLVAGVGATLMILHHARALTLTRLQRGKTD